MTKDLLNKEIIKLFEESKSWKPQTIRDNVSRFKIKYCSNCTQNAAAYILGQIVDVKLWRKLSKEDKASLPNNVPEIIERYKIDRMPDSAHPKKQVILKQVGKENPYEFPLVKFNLDDELTKDCKLIKPYRGAVKEALLTLETKMKRKLNTTKNGQDLIKECSSRGVFDRQDKSEKDGLYFLFSGAIGWFRNPPSHNKTNYEKEDALKIILFTDYLIKLFYDLCKQKGIS